MSGPNPTIGYRYNLGMHMVLAHGPVDSVNEIQIDEKPAWEGTAMDSQIYIDKPNLYGEFEGGVTGAVDLMSGKPSQGENSYLQGVLNKINGRIPAFRGVVSAVLRRPYLGNHPYLKNWAFLTQRIFARTDGEAQWNPSLAAIKEGSTEGFTSTVVKNLVNSANISYGPAFSAPRWAVESKPLNRMVSITAMTSSSGGGSVSRGYFGVMNTETEFTAKTESWTGGAPAPTAVFLDASNILLLEQLGPFSSSPVRFSAFNTSTLAQTPVGLSTPYLSGGISSPGLVSAAKSDLYGFSVVVATRAGARTDTPDATVDAYLTGIDPQTGEVSVSFGARLLPPAEFAGATEVRVVRSFRGGVWVIYSGGTVPAGTFGVAKFTMAPGSLITVNRVSYGTFTLATTATRFGLAGETFDGDLFVATDRRFALVRPSASSVSVVWENEPLPGSDTYFWYANQSLQESPLAGEFRVSWRSRSDVSDFGYYFCWIRLSDGTAVQDVGPSSTIPRIAQQPGRGDNGWWFTGNPTPGGSWGITAIQMRFVANIRNADMNPAHIIREALTDKVWGRGLPEALIDDDSFADAAATLAAEKFGLSFHWARESSINDFIQIVLSHIDANLYIDRRTGRFVLKLIRADYGDGSTLPVLDDSNVTDWSEVNQPSYNDLVNTVNVQFTDREIRAGGQVTVSNLALVQIQGREISNVRQYQGVTNRELAGRVASRDLRSMSTPLVTGTLSVTSDIPDLYPGSPFKLNSPRHGISNLICRVVDIDFGDNRRGEIKLKFVQDVFGTLYSGISSGTTTPPSSFVTPPVPSPQEVAEEAPYWFLENTVSTVDAEQALADNPDAGFLLATAARPADNLIEARVYVQEGATTLDFGTAPLAPYVDLSRTLSDDPNDKLLAITTGRDISFIEAGMIGVVGDELVVVEQVSSTSIVLGRGVLDTVPQAHLEGEEVVFLSEYGRLFSQEFNAGETRTVYVSPENSLGAVPLSSVAPQTVVFGSRAIRPLPAANVRVSGDPLRALETDNPPLDGTASLTWATRNRLTQVTSSILTWLSGNTTPEPGTEYRVIVEKQTGASPFVPAADVNVGGATSYTLDAAGLGVLDADRIRVRVVAQRGGYTSYQSKVGILEVIPQSNFVTSDGDTIETSDGDIFTVTEP